MWLISCEVGRGEMISLKGIPCMCRVLAEHLVTTQENRVTRNKGVFATGNKPWLWWGACTGGGRQFFPVWCRGVYDVRRLEFCLHALVRQISQDNIDFVLTWDEVGTMMVQTTESKPIPAYRPISFSADVLLICAIYCSSRCLGETVTSAWYTACYLGSIYLLYITLSKSGAASHYGSLRSR